MAERGGAGMVSIDPIPLLPPVVGRFTSLG